MAEATPVGNAAAVEIRLPFAPGDYTLVYLNNQTTTELARQTLKITEAPVSISAPAQAQVGSEVTVTWVGPEAHLDNIQLERQADGERMSYQYLGDSDSLTFTMPDAPGTYEFRYKFKDSVVIHRKAITVNE